MNYKGAHAIVSQALWDGTLKEQPCEICGAPSSETAAHHEDYSKPLDVRWFCPVCHYRHHRGLPPLPPEDAAKRRLARLNRRPKRFSFGSDDFEPEPKMKDVLEEAEAILAGKYVRSLL